MKKIYSVLAVIVCMTLSLVSCSNDDIPMEQKTTFTVKTSTVVEKFLAYEEEVGDLETLDSDLRIRTQLFIYDKETGKLVAEKTENLKNYTEVLKAEFMLPSGSYFCLAVTSVIDIRENIEYWEIEDTENMNSIKIIDGGYIGGTSMILGIGRGTFEVENGKSLAWNVSPSPYGSLLFVLYNNIHTFSDVDQYHLLSNRIGSNVYLQGTSPKVSISDGGYYLSKISPSNFEEYNTVYDYNFLLPINNYQFEFEARVGNEDISLGKSQTFNVESGDVYVAYLELNNEGNISCYFDKFVLEETFLGGDQAFFKNKKEGVPAWSKYNGAPQQETEIKVKDLPTMGGFSLAN